MTNKKIPILLFIIGGILILLTLIIALTTKYKNLIYCSWNGMCYTYDGIYLKYYEDDDNSEDVYLDLLWHKCFYKGRFNFCKEKVLEWTESSMIVERTVKNKKQIEEYYNVDKSFGSKQVIDMTGKAYKNKELELFFVDKDSVIVVGPNKTQEKCNYNVKAYSSATYTNLFYECPRKDSIEVYYDYYSYNIKNSSIINFKKTTKEKLTMINFSYYDENYNYKEIDYKFVYGHYKTTKESDNYGPADDIWINEEQIRLKKNNYDMEQPLKILEYNDKYILFNIKRHSYSYYYDLQKKTICVNGSSFCYQKLVD